MILSKLTSRSVKIMLCAYACLVDFCFPYVQLLSFPCAYFHCYCFPCCYSFCHCDVSQESIDLFRIFDISTHHHGEVMTAAVDFVNGVMA